MNEDRSTGSMGQRTAVCGYDMAFQLCRIRSCIVEYPIVTDLIITSCAGRHATSRYLGVAVEDESGATGYGEAATVPIWSGETAASAALLLENIITPALLHRPYAHPSQACDEMDRALITNPFLKGAVDTAIWDMLARRQSVNVSSMIADRKPVAQLATRAGIASHCVEDAVRQARTMWDLGIKTLKFKTGLDYENDRRRLAAVRDALGDEPQLTVDYNSGLLSVTEAVTAIEALLPFNLSLVEQPTPRERLVMMAQVRKEVPVPILADEGIFSIRQLEEAIALEAMDMVALYPGKNGGFSRSLEMARVAAQAGLPCLIGSNLESDLGLASMGCLARSLSAFPVDRYASDLAASLYYQSATAAESQPLMNGCYQPPYGPGFGAMPAWLERLPR